MKQNRKTLVSAAISCIMVVSFLFQSCEKDEVEPAKYEIKFKIYELAKKYDLDIQISDGVNDNSYKISSFEEIEEIFQALVYERKKEITREIKLLRNNKKSYVSNTVEKMIPDDQVRLKSSNPEENNGFLIGLKEWFYDLTWFNASIKYDKDASGQISNINLNTYYSGSSFYDYSQINSSTRISNDTIYFNTHGKEEATYGFWGMTITESNNINTSGYIDTRTGNGNLDLGGNGYWFH